MLDRTRPTPAAEPAQPARTKLHLINAGFGIIIVLIVIMVAITWLRQRDIQAALEAITHNQYAQTRLSSEMITAARNRSVLLFKILHEPDVFARDNYIQEHSRLGVTFVQARQQLLQTTLTPDEQAMLEQIRDLVVNMLEAQQQIIDDAMADQYKQAEKELIGNILPAQDKFIQILFEFMQYQSNEIQAISTSAYARQQQVLYLLVFSAVVVILLSILIGTVVSRRMRGMVGNLAASGIQLRQSNRELEFQKFALDQHAIVSITDAQGRITYANDMFCSVSQYPRDELLGQDHRILNSGLHARDFFRSMWQTIASGQVWHGEIRNRKKHGEYYWVETTIVPLLDPHGRPERYISMRTEITRIKHAEMLLVKGSEELEYKVQERTKELQENRDILQSITASAQDAIIMIDHTGNTTYWNEAAERVFGFSAGKVIGKNLHGFIAPTRYLSAYERGFTEFIQNGSGPIVGKTTEIQAKKHDGSEFPIEISISAVRIREHWQAIAIIRDITERKHLEEQLQQQAITDPLTGIYNRRRFNELLADECARSSRHSLPLSLILFDIDYFKRINDSLGHQVGDLVLKELSAHINANIRSNDHFARWGGEEFAILVTDCNILCCHIFAEKLRQLVEQHGFAGNGTISCSFGITEYIQNELPDAFLARADANLYRAKQNGRNRVES